MYMVDYTSSPFLPERKLNIKPQQAGRLLFLPGDET